MQRTGFISILLVIGATIGYAGEKLYGRKITLKETTKISEILAQPEKFNGKLVLVEGVVTDVCKMKGCWINLGSDKEFETLTFKVEDGVIVFPQEIKGMTALVQGTVEVKTVTVEEQIKQGKHHAEEQGETFDATSVKGPKVSVRIMGEGAVVR